MASWSEIWICYDRSIFGVTAVRFLDDEGQEHAYKVKQHGSIGFCVRELERRFKRAFYTADIVEIIIEGGGSCTR